MKLVLMIRWGQDLPWPNTRCGNNAADFAVGGLFCQLVTESSWQCAQVHIKIWLIGLSLQVFPMNIFKSAIIVEVMHLCTEYWCMLILTILHVQGTVTVISLKLELSGTSDGRRRLLGTGFKSSVELAIATQCAQSSLFLICKFRIGLQESKKCSIVLQVQFKVFPLSHAVVILPNSTSVSIFSNADRKCHLLTSVPTSLQTHCRRGESEFPAS